MVEIKCKVTVGSTAIGYDNFCSTDQESGYAKLTIHVARRTRSLYLVLELVKTNNGMVITWDKIGNCMSKRIELYAGHAALVTVCAAFLTDEGRKCREGCKEYYGNWGELRCMLNTPCACGRLYISKARVKLPLWSLSLVIKPPTGQESRVTFHARNFKSEPRPTCL